MINYNHLYYFHVAATEGSVAAAAARLGVKQPTVSEQLRAIERALGKQLFERSSTGMRLTAAGQIAYEHTSAMFRTAERLVQALGVGPTDVPRSLRVGISTAVARATSADFLLPLFSLPECLPTVASGETVDLMRELRGNELDLVLSESEPQQSMLGSLQHHVIERIPLVAIASIGSDPGPEWERIGLIQYRPSSAYRWAVEQFLETKSLRPRIAGEVDDPSLLVEAAARGDYVVVVPRSVARDAVKTGRVRVLAQVDAGHGGIHALYQDNVGSQLAMRAIEALMEASITSE